MRHRAMLHPLRRASAALGLVWLAAIFFAAPAMGDPAEVRVRSGPILGAFDADYFSVTCRTNAEAAVKVALAATAAEPEKVVVESGMGTIHRLKVPRARQTEGGQAGAAREYVLIVRQAEGGHAGEEAQRVPLAVPAPIAKGDKFRFVAMGDARSLPNRWAAVAAAAWKVRPRFVLFTGDMVAHGLDDASWDSGFFGPAKELLAATPFYAVLGNHEENGPLFDELFYSPSPDGRQHCWSQTLGDATIIGIDGMADWSAGGENAKWLERVLAACDSKFIFLATHYPPWTSGPHGRLNSEGRPKERAVRDGQDVIMPLLAKYRATAVIAGHDHCYERSEPQGGVTSITTGGAGAPLYPKAKDAAKQNPWSKVFAAKLHFCVIEVSGEECTLRALTPEGEVLDTRTWKARPRGRLGLAGGKVLVLLDRAEGTKAILEDAPEPFFAALGPADVSLRLEGKVSLAPSEEKLGKLKDLARQSVKDWTPEETDCLRKAVEVAQARCDKVLPALVPREWKFIKTDGRVEPECCFTRGACIVLPESFVQLAMDPKDFKFAVGIVIHETFHVYSRFHPEKRAALYGAIGFRRLTALELGPQISPRRITNPDAPDCAWAFSIPHEGGEDGPAVLLTVVPPENDAVPGTYLDRMVWGFFPIRKTEGGCTVAAGGGAFPTPLDPRKVPAFMERIGDTLTYTDMTHPEEMIAELVPQLVNYRADSAAKEPANRVLLERIEKALTAPD